MGIHLVCQRVEIAARLEFFPQLQHPRRLLRRDAGFFGGVLGFLQILLEQRLMQVPMRLQGLAHRLFQVLVEKLGDFLVPRTQDAVDTEIEIGLVQLEKLAQLGLELLEASSRPAAQYNVELNRFAVVVLGPK